MFKLSFTANIFHFISLPSASALKKVTWNQKASSRFANLHVLIVSYCLNNRLPVPLYQLDGVFLFFTTHHFSSMLYSCRSRRLEVFSHDFPITLVAWTANLLNTEAHSNCFSCSLDKSFSKTTL